MGVESCGISAPRVDQENARVDVRFMGVTSDESGV